MVQWRGLKAYTKKLKLKMFITALVILFIIKLRFPKGKSIHQIKSIYIYIYLEIFAIMLSFLKLFFQEKIKKKYFEKNLKFF